MCGICMGWIIPGSWSGDGGMGDGASLCSEISGSGVEALLGAASGASGWGISSDNLGCAWTSASVIGSPSSGCSSRYWRA